MLTPDRAFEAGPTTLRVAIGPHFIDTAERERMILSQISSIGEYVPGLSSVILLVHPDAWTETRSSRLLEHIPSSVQRAEVHILNKDCPGWRHVIRYTTGDPIPIVTLVIPSAVLKADGSLPRGLFPGRLAHVDECYILDSPNSGISTKTLLNRCLLFLTRFNSLKRLHISPSLVGDNIDDKELTMTLSHYHPHAGVYMEI